MNLRVLVQRQAKARKVIKTACITNATEEPLKETPDKTYAQIFSKRAYLFPVRLDIKILLLYKNNKFMT